MLLPLIAWAALGLSPSGTATTTTATIAPPRIDLMIMGKGEALYSIYGHAAIRVVHPDGRDLAYNFGGVDITVPFFWVTLMRGRIKTYLEITKYSDLLLRYSGEDRTIVGRTLDLTPEQARAIVRRLEAIYNSSDRYYFYHHVLDNCTTRVAKLLDEVLSGALSAQSKDRVRGTYRDWIIGRVRGRFWLYLAMDLTGNGMGDVPITLWDSTFLPDGLERAVDRARIGGRPLVVSKYLDYRSLYNDETVLWDWPWTKVYILFLAPMLVLAFVHRRTAILVFGLLAGMLGLVYIAFWLFSDYTFFWANWNLVNFPPTHLFLAFAASGRARFLRLGAATDRYLSAHAVVLAALLVAKWSGAIVQAIDPMLWLSVPITFALLVSGHVSALLRGFRLTGPPS